jgi:hypothetical protein
MPVTRHSPCRPGRAVCPHPVPRLYSLPRCKAPFSSIHPLASDCGHAGTCYPDPVKHLGERLPSITLALAASSVKPPVRTLYGPSEEALKRVEVTPHTVVLIVPLQPCIQPPKELSSRQVPMLLDPFRDPLTCRLELLAGRTPLDAWHALPIWSPCQLKAQNREAPLHAGVQTTAA